MGHEGPDEEYRFSYTLSLTSASDGVVGERHALAALPPEETRYPLYRGADKSLARQGRKQATATEDFDVHIAYLLS